MLSAKLYLSYKKVVDQVVKTLKSKEGSSTVEYVVIIGVGAVVAGLLGAALSKGNSGIISTIRGAVQKVITDAIGGGS